MVDEMPQSPFSQQLAAYHTDIRARFAADDERWEEFRKLVVTVKGRPGDDNAKGLERKVDSLLDFRSNVRTGLTGAWGLLLALIGWIATKSKFL